MEKTIWKFPLLITDEQTIQIPKNSQILTIQNQMETAMLWAIVTPSNAIENRTIICRGTGHSIEDDKRHTFDYISTSQFAEGRLVFHFFEKKSI